MYNFFYKEFNQVDEFTYAMHDHANKIQPQFPHVGQEFSIVQEVR